MALKTQHKNQQRLPSQNILAVIKAPNQINGRTIYLKYLKNQTNLCRWQILVPQKVAPKASQRNHLKRWLRETLVCFFKTSGLEKTGFDLLVIAKKEAVGVSLLDLKEEAFWLLNKLLT
jgi:ribonuclease P protein component